MGIEQAGYRNNVLLHTTHFNFYWGKLYLKYKFVNIQILKKVLTM